MASKGFDPTSVAGELRLTRLQAHRYRMPLKRPYGTARGITRAATNFLVTVTAELDDQVITGVGECQPRHALTGDGDRRGDQAWEFLTMAVQHVHQSRLPAGNRDDAVHGVRTLMAELDLLARQHAGENVDRAFRGTLLGIEVALLDVAARALGLQISELLGKKRDSISISISTISSSTKLDDVAGKVVKQERFPMTRVKGIGELEYNWQLFETVAAANRSANWDKPIWMDINEAFDTAMANTFIDGVVERMADGRLPASVVIEGILPKAEVTELPTLQKRADDACQALPNGTGLDLRIMPDEGMWDVTDLEKVNAHGGCRALNIKAPKAGGLLASLDLAEAAVAADPGIHVCIGGMLGTSDLTAWALHNLARALPRVDYLTTVPPTNVEQRIAEPAARYHERGSNVIAEQTMPGLGTELMLEKVRPYIDRSFDTSGGADVPEPAVEQPATRPAARVRSTDPVSIPSGSGTKTLVFAGDTSLGDVHINAKGGVLLDRLQTEPSSFFDQLRPLISSADALVLNLETVLADAPTSPFEGKKRFLGWDSPERTVGVLQDLGVAAVGLANNHTMDYGSAHLIDTVAKLEEGGIRAFGAGSTLEASAVPLTLAFDFDGTEHRAHVIAAMEVQSKLRDEFAFYADEHRPGVNPMSPARVAEQIRRLRDADPASLIIVYPHWGGNYKWANEAAQRTSERLFEAGADLIIGHGAHMLQQCGLSNRRAVVYSLGNFVFNWAGRFDKFDVPPYSLVARVYVNRGDDGWDVGLRLYPIVSDNRATGFRPRPLTEEEFTSLWSALLEADLDESFAEHATPAQDELGYHIAHSFNTAAEPESSPLVADDTAPADAPLPQSAEVFSAGSTSRLLAQAVVDRGFPFEVVRVPGPPGVPDKLRSALKFTVKDRTYFIRTATIVKARPDGQPGATIDGRAVTICKRKDVTTAILREQGFSVPRGMSFAAADMRGALLYFDAIGRTSPDGLCVKPAAGNKGKKIFLGITDRTSFRSAFQSVAREYSTVLVEESVSGDVLRFLYIGGTVVAVRRGVPASVGGDGTAPIAELVKTRNAELRERGADRHARLRLGPDEVAFLARHGFDPESVPAAGTWVFLSSLSNRHAAAEIVDCTDDVHPSYREIVERAAGCIPDLTVCGVDLMIKDLTVPAEPANHYFIELNTTPGLRGHHGPNQGTPRDVAGMVIDHVATVLP